MAIQLNVFITFCVESTTFSVPIVYLANNQVIKKLRKAKFPMDIYCTFENIPWEHLGMKYTCVIRETSGLEIKLPGTQVKSFKGIHKPGKWNKDVEAIAFNDVGVEYFPQKLSDSFSNLVAVQVRKCGLKGITKQDLKGLDKLEMLWLPYNQVTFLPDDLFESTRNLRTVSFFDNWIENLDAKIFVPIKSTLEFCSFKDNPGFSGTFGKNIPYPIESFMRDISNSKTSAELARQEATLRKREEILKSEFGSLKTREKQLERENAKLKTALGKFKIDNDVGKLADQKKDHEQSDRLGDLFSSSKYSDFTIKLRDQEFKVHKCILAAQSSVFDRMFTADTAEAAAKSMKKVSNFSATAFGEFLKYFYDKTLSVEGNALELFVLSSEFDFQVLRSRCEDVVIRSLDAGMALDAFNLGHAHSSEKLKLAAFRMLKISFPEIGDYLYSKPDLVNNMIEAKILFEQENCGSSKGTIL